MGSEPEPRSESASESASPQPNGADGTPVPHAGRGEIRIAGMTDPDPDRDHWLDRTPQERLAAAAAMREAFYGRDAVRGRIERVIEIAWQEPR